MNLYENTDPYGDPLSLDRLPLERNARLTAGNAWNDGDYDPADITRSQARELAAALLAYADTVDPGPGAPYPEPKPMTPEELREANRRFRQAMYANVGRMLDEAYKSAPESPVPVTFLSGYKYGVVMRVAEEDLDAAGLDAPDVG